MGTIAKNELECWELRLKEAIKNEDEQETTKCKDNIDRCENPRCFQCYWHAYLPNKAPWYGKSSCRNIDSKNYKKSNPTPCERFNVK